MLNILLGHHKFNKFSLKDNRISEANNRWYSLTLDVMSSIQKKNKKIKIRVVISLLNNTCNNSCNNEQDI